MGQILEYKSQAAVHLGQDSEVDVRFVLIRDQTQVIGVTIIDFKEFTCRSTSLWCSRAHQITNAENFFFSDSVLCVGKMGDGPIAAWKN